MIEISGTVMQRNEPANSNPKVKIGDVARAAGVSTMSVSRALRGVEGVSAKTSAVILKAADRLGYAPNRMAASLAAANSTLIGVSVPTLADDVFTEIFAGMRGVFNKAGFQTVIDTTEYQQDREALWIERMLTWRPAGVILSGFDHNEKALRRLKSAGIPILEIWDYSETPVDLCVGIDHFQAGYDMGRHLTGLGYRRPAYVGVEHGRDPRAEERLKGLCAAFAEQGARLCDYARVREAPSFEGGKKGTEIILNSDIPAPDILYYLNDHMAFGGLVGCKQHGLSVPADIGVVGFNGLNINNVLDQPMTTSVTPRNILGSRGAAMLVAKILGARPQSKMLLPTRLFAGETTCHRNNPS
jgi:LacI family gluconate utilization system Gnt-I transcriptional repressor